MQPSDAMPFKGLSDVTRSMPDKHDGTSVTRLLRRLRVRRISLDLWRLSVRLFIWAECCMWSSSELHICVFCEDSRRLLHVFSKIFAYPSIDSTSVDHPKIYFSLSGNFRKFVNYLCQSAVSNSNIAKWCCKTSMSWQTTFQIFIG